MDLQVNANSRITAYSYIFPTAAPLVQAIGFASRTLLMDLFSQPLPSQRAKPYPWGWNLISSSLPSERNVGPPLASSRRLPMQSAATSSQHVFKAKSIPAHPKSARFNLDPQIPDLMLYESRMCKRLRNVAKSKTTSQISRGRVGKIPQN